MVLLLKLQLHWIVISVWQKYQTRQNVQYCLPDDEHKTVETSRRWSKVRFITGSQGPDVRSGTALHICNLDDRSGWVVSLKPRPLYPLERLGTHCTEGWVGPRASLDVYENLAPTEIRSPDRSTRNQSLYQLSYPGTHVEENNNLIKILIWKVYILFLEIYNYFLVCGTKNFPKHYFSFGHPLVSKNNQWSSRSCSKFEIKNVYLSTDLDSYEYIPAAYVTIHCMIWP
jgi:hypothetical protein